MIPVPTREDLRLTAGPPTLARGSEGSVSRISARSIELPGGYGMELTEAEARALLTYARSHEMRHLERDLRQELASFERRQRESGPTRSSG